MPCEHVFSSEMETMLARRNRIKYNLMETLQMLKFSINQGNELNFTVGFRRQTELWELEELDLLDSSIPEDLPAFQRSFLFSPKDNNSSTLSEESELDYE